MKILHTVESYLPSRHGMQQVVSRVSDHLVRMGHEVTVATSYNPDRNTDMINGVKIVDFKISGNLVKGIEGELDRYHIFLRKSDFDIVTNFAAQQWATDGMITILDDVRGKKVFVPTGFSALYNRKYDYYFNKMRNWMNKYDINVFSSYEYRDICFAKENNISKIIVIPNGASKDEFMQPSRIDIRLLLGLDEDCFMILHVGSYNGFKGHREAKEIFRRAKLRNTCFLFVSTDMRRFGPSLRRAPLLRFRNFFQQVEQVLYNKRIIFKEITREEIVDAFKQADLFLFPSNLECSPVVLFECMASRTPFLTSDVGNAKEIIKWSNHAGSLLPTQKDEVGRSHVKIPESARILEDSYSNTEKLKGMAENGFNQWRRRFTWEKIAKQYEKLYRQLARG